MWFETQMYNNGVVVTVDMGVDTIQTLENLAQQTGECLGERDTYVMRSCISRCSSRLRDKGNWETGRTHQFDSGTFARYQYCSVPNSSSVRYIQARTFSSVACSSLNLAKGIRTCELSAPVAMRHSLPWDSNSSILIGRLHFGACLRRAELCYGTVEQVNLVVEIDNYRSMQCLH